MAIALQNLKINKRTSAGRALGPGKKLITRPSDAIMIQIIVNKNEIKLS